MRQGYVYLMERDGLYKIGRSIDPYGRAIQLKGRGPAILVVHTIKSEWPVYVEAALHRKFARKQVVGEWFRLSQRDVRLICQVERCDRADDLPDSLRFVHPVSHSVSAWVTRKMFRAVHQRAREGKRTLSEELILMMEYCLEQEPFPVGVLPRSIRRHALRKTH